MLTGHIVLSRIPGCPAARNYQNIGRSFAQPCKNQQNICRSFAQPCGNHLNIHVFFEHHAGTIRIYDYAGLFEQPCRNHQNICTMQVFCATMQELFKYMQLLFEQPCRKYLNEDNQFRNKSETTKDAAGLLLRKKV